MSDDEDLPLLSESAARDWQQLTDVKYGAVVAWSEAQRRHLPDLSADEVRYHKPTETVLMRVANVLVGIYDATTADRRVRQKLRGEP